jgi:hypothetical protein
LGESPRRGELFSFSISDTIGKPDFIEIYPPFLNISRGKEAKIWGLRKY